MDLNYFIWQRVKIRKWADEPGGVEEKELSSERSVKRQLMQKDFTAFTSLQFVGRNRNANTRGSAISFTVLLGRIAVVYLA